ncbi:Beta-galactosidase BgaP [compost metagenome]
MEAARRVKNGNAYLFLLNHNATAAEVEIGADEQKDLLTNATVKGTVTVPARGVMILESMTK